MKIALWGYGRTGRRFREKLESAGQGEFELTAIFDRNWKAMEGRGDVPVLDPERMPAMYEAGVFRAVIITVAAIAARREMEAWLRARGVPCREMWMPESFASAEELFGAKPTVSRDGAPDYERFPVRGAYLSFDSERRSFYVFSRDGRIDGDFWHSYQLEEHPEFCTYRPDFDANPPETLAGEYCLLNRCWCENYWHFLFECLDRVVLMEEAGYRGKYIIPKASFAAPLLSLLGIGQDRCVATTLLQPDRIYAPETLWEIHPRYGAVDTGAVLARAGERIAAAAGEGSREYPERIFVRRVKGRALHLPEGLAEKYGFVTVVPEELTVEEQIRYFRHARIVLSPHGANTANCLFMRPGSVLVETFPFNYINPCCLHVCAAKGIRYLEVTEENYDVWGREWEKFADRKRPYAVSKPALEAALANAVLLSRCAEETQSGSGA